jgi:hypothetical protein
MRKHLFALLVLVAAGTTLTVAALAVAGDGAKKFSGDPLIGYEENPDVSTVASGSFDAQLSQNGDSIHYVLSYSGLEGTVTQSHVHFGKTAINGGISFWLCETATNPSPSASTPTCPAAPGGTVEGDITALEVIGPAGQGIEVGNLAEILAAMQAGHAYANVHSTKWPGGEIRAQINDGNRGEGNND